MPQNAMQSPQHEHTAIAAAIWLHTLEMEGKRNVYRPKHLLGRAYDRLSAPCTGFKSYLAPVSLGPFAAFTCVVGPNGSGKSIVVSLPCCVQLALLMVICTTCKSCLQGDAIAFVLGGLSKEKQSTNLKIQNNIHDSLQRDPGSKAQVLVTSMPCCCQVNVPWLSLHQTCRSPCALCTSSTKTANHNLTLCSALLVQGHQSGHSKGLKTLRNGR